MAKKPGSGRPWFDNMSEMSTTEFKKLLEKKKKEEKGNVSAVVNAVDEDRSTALHTACRSHRKDLVEILLSERADATLVDANSYTALHAACCEDSNEEIIKLILAAPGVDVNARNVDRSTALHYFAKNYNSPYSAEVLQLMIQKGAGVNDVNIKGETPLLLTLLPLKGIRTSTARLLIQAGADVNIAASSTGDSPLHWAAERADQELITLLLEKGADPTAKNKHGKTPADRAEAEKRHHISSMLRQAEIRWVKQKELEAWLNSIGLSKFFPNFKKEEFDMSSLSEITADVLMQLGMPAGSRVTFLKAQREYIEAQQREKREGNLALNSPPANERKPTSTLLPSTHIISYSDITLGRMLGKGFFAEVREGEYRGSPIAVKIIYRESFRNKGDIELFYQEADILSKLRFPTVVQFIGICIGDQHCIITEYMKDGSLYQKLHDYPDDILRSQKWQLQIAIDVARGMNYLHGLNPPVLHRDLTSKNILLDGKTAKVADFGLSKEKDLAATMTASVGALPWAAPEVFKGGQFTEAADVYSFGIILWELWSGKDPQGDMAPLAFANKVAHEGYRPPMPPHTPTGIKDLITRCWDADPGKRPSFDEILKYLKSYEASGHDRHKKDKREKSTKKSSSKPVEPTKTSSETNLLSTYGGNPASGTASPESQRANSDLALLESYGGAQDNSLSKTPSAGNMYINSNFTSGRTDVDLGKSISADQLRKHSDGEMSRAKAELLKASGSSTSSQSDGDLVSSGRLRASAPDVPVPTIAVPVSAAASGPDSGSGSGRNSSTLSKQPRTQLLHLHERHGNGPVIFHNPSAPKSKDASPTHLRRVSMDEGNRSPLKESKDKEKSSGGDSPKSKP